MSNYVARTSEPSTTNKYYIHKSKGGLNECILISGNSCLPNCVGYAWGRAYELMGARPKLSKGNAENWYNYSDGYERGKTPRLGAVICWAKGKVANASDGCGHVAIVEKINSDGSIVISESGYNSYRFKTTTIKKSYYLGKNYTFQGFIYLPISFEEVKQPTSVKYKLGDVVNINGVYVSSTSDTKLTPAITKGTITKILTGKRNPYLLNDGNIGWVNDSCIVTSESVSNTNKVYHKVVKGDSLWNLASRYLGNGAKYPEIKKLNNLTSDTIYVGQTLRIK